MSATQVSAQFPFWMIADFSCETEEDAQDLIERFVAEGGTGQALMEQLNEHIRERSDFGTLMFHDQFLPILRLIPDFSSCEAPAVVHAVTHRAFRLLERLIGRGASMYTRLAGESALVVAAADQEEVEALAGVRILLEAGADVDMTNNHGETALMHAAASGYLEVVQQLLAGGADVSRRDSLGRTALHWALGRRARVSRCVEIAELLIDAGAGVDARDFERNTPLHALVGSDGLDAKASHAGIDLLLRRGADIEARNEGELTPILVAACNIQRGEFLLQQLYQAGADLDVKVRGRVKIDEMASPSGTERVLRSIRMGLRLESAMTPDDMPAPAPAVASCNPGAL